MVCLGLLTKNTGRPYPTRKLLVENELMKPVRRKYIEKLLNENIWDNATMCD